MQKLQKHYAKPLNDFWPEEPYQTIFRQYLSGQYFSHFLNGKQDTSSRIAI